MDFHLRPALHTLKHTGSAISAPHEPHFALCDAAKVQLGQLIHPQGFASWLSPIRHFGVPSVHRVGKTGPLSLCSARLPVAYGGTFTFSAWVLIPKEFRGQRIVAKLSGCEPVSKWNAQVRASGRWQRIWVSGNLPMDANSISCHLIAEGSASDTHVVLSQLVFGAACRTFGLWLQRLNALFASPDYYV